MDVTLSFGYWLRRRRKALDLTQTQFAQQVGCALQTIQKLEADERRPSQSMAERLADALALAPSERAVFLQVAAARLGTHWLCSDGAVDGLSPRRLEPRQHRLPVPLTALVGRSQEVADICIRLGRDDVRLVRCSI